jgi:diguanylate cyclase (GGDEF)-like protein
LQTLVGYRRAEVLMRADDEVRVAASAGDHARLVDSVVHSAGRRDEVLAEVLASNVPVVLDRRFPAYLADDPPALWLGVPLWLGGATVGALALERGEVILDERTRGIVAMFADQAALAIQNARLFSEVHAQATVDPLTQVYNRREGMRLAEQELRRAQRHGRPFALAMLDVDHFKKVNDTHGHPVGDAVLVEVASRLRGILREVDLLARYGGEEFMVVLPETAADEGRRACERIREVIAGWPVSTERGPLSITLSVGICAATADPEGDRLELASLIARADGALYQAKQNGRNRVETAKLQEAARG